MKSLIIEGEKFKNIRTGRVDRCSIVCKVDLGGVLRDTVVLEGGERWGLDLFLECWEPLDKENQQTEKGDS